MNEILEITIVLCSFLLTVGVSFFLLDLREYVKVKTELLKEEKEYRKYAELDQGSIHDLKEIYYGS
jgi:hypothetical protein